MDPEWMQWIPCSMVKCVTIDAVDSMQCHWMQWIPCSMVKCIPIERSVFHEAWLNGSRLNAVDSMQRGPMDLDWTQYIPCSEAQWIPIECRDSMQHGPMFPIECSGWNEAWLNAVDFMHHGPMDPDWMQWIPCSVAQWILIECSGFHAPWGNESRLNAVYSMQRGTRHPDLMQWI